MLRFVLVSLLFGLLLAQQSSPQQPATPAAPQEDQDLRITTTVDRVTTPAIAFNRDGGYVSGLEAKNFRLYDNGAPQDITVDVTFIPISMVICIQANSNATYLIPRVNKIGNMIQPLVVGDQGVAAVIAYDGRVRTLQEFTNNTDEITKAVKTIIPGSSSNRMIDAVVSATRMLSHVERNRRRVILLIGETRDVASEARARETLINLQLTNIQLYAVDMSRFMTTITAPTPVPRPDPRPPAAYGPLPAGQASTPTTIENLKGLNGQRAEFMPLMVELFKDAKAIFKANPVELFTKGTGGSEFGFHGQGSLERAIQDIGEELHAGYMISYSPNNKGEGGFHEIKVEVVGHPEVKRVQTRPGYWLAPKF
jgi:VWFA-related protein